MTTMTLTRLGLCPDSGHRIPVTDEALNDQGYGDVLCPSCLTVFHVEGKRHKHHLIDLVVPEHQAHTAG